MKKPELNLRRWLDHIKRGTATGSRRTGTDLRNRSWQIINRAHLDYAPKFIGLTEEFNHLSRAIDGLIRTPMGYYRLAEDMRDGTRVLLHSYERSQLTGIEKNGRIVLGPGATDLYGVTARKGVRGAIFRDDMKHDIRYLEVCFQKDLNLHTEENVAAGPDGKPLRIVRLANGQVSFGIYETSEGQWKVRLYHNLRKSWDRAARFVEADNVADDSLKSRLLTLSRDLDTFDTYEEAFQHVRRFWKNDSQLIFKGRRTLADPEKFTGWEKIRARLLSTALYFAEEKIYRDWRRAIGIAVGVGFLSTLWSGAPFVGALLGLGSGVVWSTVGKSIEVAFGSYEDRRMQENDRQEFEALRPYFEQNKIADYLRQDAANPKRFRKKLEPSVLPHLRLLDTDEADMIYDDGTVSPPVNILKDYERLSTAAYRYFGAQFDATHAEKGLLACMFPNGLLSLVHVDEKTRATRHYLTYSERFNAFENGTRKHLDPELTALPGPGPIHKITHRKSKDFRYVSLDGKDFIADLMAKTGENVQGLRVFGFPLTDLFNAQDIPGEIEPHITDAVPVAKLLEPSLSRYAAMA